MYGPTSEALAVGLEFFELLACEGAVSRRAHHQSNTNSKLPRSLSDP
jgi:hypothetical protein